MPLKLLKLFLCFLAAVFKVIGAELKQSDICPANQCCSPFYVHIIAYKLIRKIQNRIPFLMQIQVSLL